MSILAILIVLFIGFIWCISVVARRYRRFLPFFVALILALIMGVRYRVGKDYHSYEEIFYYPYSVHRLSVEPLWLFFCDGLRALGARFRMFCLLSSFIIIWGYYSGIRKISPLVYVSFVLFVACGLYYESANTVRQCTAQAVLFAGFPSLVKREKGKFALYCLLSVAFHYTAIIGIITMLLCCIRVPKWILIFSVFSSFFFGEQILYALTDGITSFFMNVGKYRYSVDTFDPGLNSGMMRVFYSFIGIGCCLLYERLKRQTEYTYILVNLVIVGVILYNVFYLFMPAARLVRYCFPFIILLFPMILKLFKSSSRAIVLLLSLSAFMAFLLKGSIDLPYEWDFNF